MFKAEQKVFYTGMRMPATIVSGPYPASGGAQRWLITKADGNVTLARETQLSAVQTRRDIVAERYHVARHGRPMTTTTAGSIARSSAYIFADGLLAALDADAGAAKSRPLAVGDQVRILTHRHNGARVSVGDILTVGKLWTDGERFETDAPRATYPATWTFRLVSEGTGWERV